MRGSLSQPRKAPIAGEMIAAQYRRPLVRWFRKQGLDHDAAEDCAHESFVRLCSRDASYVYRVDAYLFSVASSVLMDLRRRAKVRHEAYHIPIDDFDGPSDEPTPIRVSESREALRQLSETLDELPVGTREMFLLNRLDRLSYNELAILFDVSVSTVEKRMMKAIAHVRRRFARKG